MEDVTGAVSSPTAAQTEPTGGTVDDYVDIFFSPADVFRRRRPTEWLKPFLLTLGLSVVLYVLLLPAQRIQMEAQAAAMTPEAREAMAAMGGAMQVFGAVFVAIAVTVMTFLLALWMLAVARMLDIRVGYRQTLLAVVFSGFIGLLHQALAGGALLLAARDGDASPLRDMSFGVLRFLDPDALTPALAALLAQADVFAIWAAAIWAVGLRVMGRAEWTPAIVAAAIVWATAGIPPALLALLGPGPG